ncbi:MAG: aminotransferase class V-fold PLP-dependent enzyme, partial [Pseudomonadota bacterium]
PPFVDLHSATWTETNGYELADGARRFQNWESFVAGRVGLMEAVRYARAVGMSYIEDRVTKLAQVLRDELSTMKGVSVHDLGQQKSGIVTFTRDSIESKATAEGLRDQGINVSVAPVTGARLDFEARNLPAMVRASVHYFNTHEEIARFADAVKGIH